MENTSGIQPYSTKVLILPDPVEKKSEGGIWKPDTTVDKEEYKGTKATLIACGGDAFGDVNPPRPVPGDRVYIAVNTGYFVFGKDGVKYKMIHDDDIVGIITEE